MELSTPPSTSSSVSALEFLLLPPNRYSNNNDIGDSGIVGANERASSVPYHNHHHRHHRLNRSVFLFFFSFIIMISFCQGFQIWTPVSEEARSKPHPQRRDYKMMKTSSSSSSFSTLFSTTNSSSSSFSFSESSPHLQAVQVGIHALYPPRAWNMRISASRTDGYWPYIAQNRAPPPSLIYGEFDVGFFAHLLQVALTHYHHHHHHDDFHNSSQTHSSVTQGEEDGNVKRRRGAGWHGCTFVDLGSGTGRLVLAAAALHPEEWTCCRGIEVLPKLHEMAVETLRQCCSNSSSHRNASSSSRNSKEKGGDDSTKACSTARLRLAVPHNNSNSNSNQDQNPSMSITVSEYLPMAPVELVCGSMVVQEEEEKEEEGIPNMNVIMNANANVVVDWSDANVVFAFSSCMSTPLMESIACTACSTNPCQVGTLIITTDVPLPLPLLSESKQPGSNCRRRPLTLELVDQLDGNNWATGGTSTAYIHRVVEKKKNENE